MNPLNAYLALEIMHDSIARAERDAARAAREQPPAPATTPSRSGAPRRTTGRPRAARAARRPCRAGGAALVAEVDERMLAAHWISDDVTLADPFHPTAELVTLLDTRARHLGERPRLSPARCGGLTVLRRARPRCAYRPVTPNCGLLVDDHVRRRAQASTSRGLISPVSSRKNSLKPL